MGGDSGGGLACAWKGEKSVNSPLTGLTPEYIIFMWRKK
jgi:hypothetical protein